MGNPLQDQKIVLLGAGGAATAIMVQCALDGAKSVTVFNRGASALEKAEKIGKKMKKEGVSCMLDYCLLSEEELLTETIRQGTF